MKPFLEVFMPAHLCNQSMQADGSFLQQYLLEPLNSEGGNVYR